MASFSAFAAALIAAWSDEDCAALAWVSAVFSAASESGVYRLLSASLVSASAIALFSAALSGSTTVPVEAILASAKVTVTASQAALLVSLRY